MKDSLRDKLDQAVARHEEVNALLNDADTMADAGRFRALGKEYAELDPVVQCYRALCQVQADHDEAARLRSDPDPEMRAMAEDSWQETADQAAVLEDRLQRLLLPRDPDDSRNVFLEIRAGTGGDEAAIFAGDLFRMYARYAEHCGWQLEILSERPGEHGGYKEIISRIAGRDVYARLKFESGVHRVQRVPATEAQGRIHTSACTVAVLPEQEDIDSIDLNKADLRIDTFRASGAGGQHVNKTDSAIRITHLPTGLVVECQDERSQHKNRARAMSLLAARLLDQARRTQQQAQASERRNLVGSGDRSERIRTYNFPQGRLTDHRINLTLYKLGDIMEGHLDEVIQPLVNEHQADLLATLAS